MEGFQMTAAEKIYENWHHFAKERDTDGLISLYAEDAEFESPLVPIIMNQKSGVLTGHTQIRAFLEEGTQRRPNELVRWYRDGSYLVNDSMLVWEYPRQMPDGEQVDILELMELRNGKIQRHRIYWGWFGTQMLIKSALDKSAK
ncbi:nuclear transport factor 2 family protein [Streptococcus macacae]|nr:nuclear transport factor 2 family protein [Streptococcus macacae]